MEKKIREQHNTHIKKVTRGELRRGEILIAMNLISEIKSEFKL